MSATKKLLDDMQGLYEYTNMVELHWMYEEFQREKSKENEDLQQIEVDIEIVPNKETEEEISSEVGGGGHNFPEIFNHQPVFTVRDAGNIRGGVLPKSKEQGNTLS